MSIQTQWRENLTKIKMAGNRGKNGAGKITFCNPAWRSVLTIGRPGGIDTGGRGPGGAPVTLTL